MIGHSVEQSNKSSEVAQNVSPVKVEAKKSRGSATTSFGPFRLGKTIGQGEFGKVKLGYHLQTGQEVAIKFVKKMSVDSAVRRSKLMREIAILQSISNKYIVQLDQVIETEAYIGLIMEYASGGELFEYILAREFLSEKESGRLFAQLIDAVSYLHVNCVIHRDLKLENILLDRFRNLKLTDFGFANVVSDGSEGMLRTSCGSPCYAAPELVVNNEYIGELADIWSCGVILYAMLCGTLPYDDDPNNVNSENLVALYKYIMQTTLKFPVPLSKEAMHLIYRILNTDPTRRANLVEIKTHKWLKPYTNIFQTYVKQDLPIATDFTNAALPPSSSLPIPIPSDSMEVLDSSLQTVPDSPEQERIVSTPPARAVPELEMVVESNDPEEEEKSQSAEKSPVHVDPIQDLVDLHHVPLELKAPPNSLVDSSVLEEKIGNKDDVSDTSVKAVVDIIHTETDNVLSSEPRPLTAEESSAIAADGEDIQSPSLPIHDLRSQIFPTVEIMTEEEPTVEIIFDEAPASESIDASEPLSDVPILSKQMSLASMGSSKLQRKSTTSFLFMEAPSIARPSAQAAVLVQDILSDESHDGSVLKIDENSQADNEKDLTSSNSSNSPKKVVSFPENTPEEDGNVNKRSPLRKPRHSLNLNVRPKDSTLFREEARRAQSMDVRRGSETPSMATVMSQTSKGLGYHSGPIDQRAITIFSPQVVIEMIQLVLLELNLSFAPSPDSPYKLIVVKSPPGTTSSGERAMEANGPPPPGDLRRQVSRGSRVSMQSTRSTYTSKKQSTGPIGSAVMSLFQKIRYISLFGFQYNRGYDGSTLLPPVRNQNKVDDSYVKFHIVVHKIRYIYGIYIVDLKRHKGDIWEFKRLYNDIIVNLDLKGTNMSFL